MGARDSALGEERTLSASPEQLAPLVALPKFDTQVDHAWRAGQDTRNSISLRGGEVKHMLHLSETRKGPEERRLEKGRDELMPRRLSSTIPTPTSEASSRHWF